MAESQARYAALFVGELNEHSRTKEQLRLAEQQLRALVGRLHNVREEEAKRIARELHDDLGQQLTALNMELGDLEAKLGGTDRSHQPLARMRAGVDHMIGVVQQITGELRLAQLDVLGLSAAIDWQSREFSGRSGILCRVARLDEVGYLSGDQSIALFRILQEALTNIARHAGASEVEIRLEARADQTALVVRDNGRGITAAETAGQPSIGLIGMRERASLVGGRVVITGSPGAGTTVLVTIPRPPTVPAPR